MKEDIFKFKNLCTILRKEKGWKLQRISIETGLSQTCIDKIMKVENTDDMKGIRASTLGIIQNFCKKYRDHTNYAGIEPNEMRFRRAGCFDVGVQCGGWGHIVMELGVEDRDKLSK